MENNLQDTVCSKQAESPCHEHWSRVLFGFSPEGILPFLSLLLDPGQTTY